MNTTLQQQPSEGRSVDMGTLLDQLGVPGHARSRARHLSTDSRDVVADSAFIAIAGQRTDGHFYIEEAVRKGAKVVIHESGRDLGFHTSVYNDVDFIPVRGTREFSKSLAPLFYDHPSRRMKVVAVTGTNGKTTTTYVLDRLYTALGKRTGVINTICIRYANRSFRLDNILPEPVVVQRTLCNMMDAGVNTLILEVSSYALVLDRVHGVDVDAAIFTNITRDHLDVHGTMEDYLRAKLLLFDLLQTSSKPEKRSSLWRDCRCFDAIQKHAAEMEFARTVYAIGPPWERTEREAQLCAENIQLQPTGTTFDLNWKKRRVPTCRTSLLGTFNVLNILGALAVEWDFLDQVTSGDRVARELLDYALDNIQVPGRLERVPNRRGATILVDYAHTDDGLEQVLMTLRALPHRKLFTVFGCGGDRDRSKRPLMGRVATRHSDLVILTSDNPRSEDPRAIIKDIEAGIAADGQYIVIEDREMAIKEALGQLREGDVLLVAGKGHEDYQIIGNKVIPFSDSDIILKHLEF
ncbi:MAG: UDP-N-acetylmuramoyl-L-alanyl-D-glutamate--2,6-diaminopimelate ligase [Armatimonadetes bacterium]|nr:UDP-N-acetylmuramoyl-L-alanyl-D-glutamate--2,6-diaminopimelate ligase [Armatimonadota bacterium]